MNQKQVGFSKYGKDFQEDLCHLILDDRPFADQIFEVLDINFLELKYLRVFTEKVLEYREKYVMHPNRKVMVTIIKSGLGDHSEATRKQIVDYFSRVMIKEVVENSQFIKDTALDFCRKQKLKEAMVKSAKLINTCSFDEISKLINDAIILGESNDFGYDYVKDFEKRFELKARNPISTAWSEFDTLMGGGLGSGELGVVIAPTGAGKSMVLAHLGAVAVKAGKTVVHYTLELSDVVVAQRYDSCITKVSLNSASVNTLRSHLERLKTRDIKVDTIIVDYGDLLKPVTKNKEKRVELESIYEGLRGLAQEFECPIWTASQTNRSGLNAEVITMEAISEAFSKCFVADFIFTVSRTVQDKQTNGGRFFVAKNRFGPDGLVYPIEMVTKNVHIDVKSMNISGDEVVTTAVTAKEQSDILKEKYKKFRKKKRITKEQ